MPSNGTDAGVVRVVRCAETEPGKIATPAVDRFQLGGARATKVAKTKAMFSCEAFTRSAATAARSPAALILDAEDVIAQAIHRVPASLPSHVAFEVDALSQRAAPRASMWFVNPASLREPTFDVCRLTKDIVERLNPPK